MEEIHIEKMKLTDEQIVTALEVCAKDGSCMWENECPLREDRNCHVTLSAAALDLIQRLQGEKSEQKKENNNH